ncbi:MAG: thiamine pyrophosphate-dependent enzyme [Chloroflexota bacterium]|nr:thiamine pyrophosphate-dependent enzyme [Chloroflexota bacterium]
MISSIEAVKAIEFHREEALVVSTSSALKDWAKVSTRRDLDVDLSDCMDRGPAVGLGLSLAQPDRKVLVLDCDATLRTDLAGLSTIGESQPNNFVHFCFDDVAFSSTEGIPIHGLASIDFAGIARSSGYTKIYEFNDLEELYIGLEQVMAEQGPIFVLIKVVREEVDNEFPARSMADGWALVREALNSAD